MPNLGEILHRKRWVTHFFKKSQFAVAGGYHYGNLGDMALGQSISDYLASISKKSDIQTIYNLSKWKTREYTVVGGGAIGYNYVLNQLLKRHQGNFKKLGFFGVDFNEETYNDQLVNMLANAAFVGTRSDAQAKKMKQIIGSSNIYSFPDLGFSLDTAKFVQKRALGKTQQEAKVFLNVVPLYSAFKNKQLIPYQTYAKERPELYKNLKEIQTNYQQFFKELAKTYLQNGLKVQSWSFTPADHAFAKYIFKDFAINHLPYNPNPKTLSEILKPQDIAVTTRLHATIFSFRSGANVIPIAYSRKNEELLDQFGFQKEQYLNIEDLVQQAKEFPALLQANESFISDLEQKSTLGIQLGIKKLLEANQ